MYQICWWNLQLHEQVRLALAEMSWYSNIPGVSEGWLEDLWQLLGDNPLGGTVINAMLEPVSLYLQQSGSKDTVIIANTDVSHAIAVCHTTKNLETYLTKSLPCSRLLSKYVCKILLVVYYPEFHWSACLVDLWHHHVMFGNGLGWSLPTMLGKNLLEWLEQVFSCNFSDYNDLPCGKQLDAHSCGIVAVNVIRHDILDEMVWITA